MQLKAESFFFNRVSMKNDQKELENNKGIVYLPKLIQRKKNT